MVSNGRRFILYLVKTITVLLCIYYIGRYIVFNLGEIKANEISYRPWFLVYALCVALVSIFSNSLIWHYLAARNNCTIGLKQDIITRMYSEFGKYVPGRALGFAMVLYSYAQRGKGKKNVSACLFFEFIATLAASICVFIISLLFVDFHLSGVQKIVAAWIMLTLLVFLHPKILERALNWMIRFTRYEPVRLDVSYRNILNVVFFNIINWIVLGSAIYLLINSVIALPIRYLLFVISSFAFASFSGFIAIIAPAGLGVREGIFIYFLSMIVPKSIAGIASILSRLLLIIAELILLAVIFLYQLNGNNSDKKRQLDRRSSVS